MAKDSIVKFCVWIGPRSAYLVMTNCPLDGRGQGHVTSLGGALIGAGGHDPHF